MKSKSRRFFTATFFIVASFTTYLAQEPAKRDENRMNPQENEKRDTTKVEVSSLLQSSSRLYRFSEDDMFGYINELGKVIIPAQFDVAESFAEEMAVVAKSYEQRLYLKDSETEKNVLHISFERRCGYINLEGKIVIEPLFQECKNFSNGMALVKNFDSPLYFYINSQGQKIIEKEFENASNFSEGLAAVKVNEKWGYINAVGEFVIPPEFSIVKGFKEGLAFVWKDDKWGIIDKSAKFVVEPIFDFDGFSNNPDSTHTYSFSEGLAAVKINEKWGYINKSGDFVIKPEFEAVNNFSSNRAAVKTNGRWGYINKEGQFLIKPEFFTATNFSEGIASVSRYENNQPQWLFYKPDGSLLYKRSYELAGSFTGDLAPVATKNTSKIGYINKSGKTVFSREASDSSSDKLSLFLEQPDSNKAEYSNKPQDVPYPINSEPEKATFYLVYTGCWNNNNFTWEEVKKDFARIRSICGSQRALTGETPANMKTKRYAFKVLIELKSHTFEDLIEVKSDFSGIIVKSSQWK